MRHWSNVGCGERRSGGGLKTHAKTLKRGRPGVNEMHSTERPGFSTRNILSYPAPFTCAYVWSTRCVLVE
jgi:hypothetical protein